MTQEIVIFGGGFAPAGEHHRNIALMLRKHFTKGVVYPSGPRPDKPTVNDLDPLDRAVMVDLTFQNIPGFLVDLSDLEQGVFTRTHALDEMFRSEGEVWHAVGADWLQGGGSGNSFIHRVWMHGPELWRRLNFAVICRSEYPLDEKDLPPRYRIFSPNFSGSGSEIRKRAVNHESLDGLVVPKVKAYMERYKIYRGGVSDRHTSLSIEEPRAIIFADNRNPRAQELIPHFRNLEDRKNPNLILVIGGDGTMLHAIRKHWRRRIPFFGVNAGRVGHLLNDDTNILIPRFIQQEFKVWQLPLLYVETQDMQGNWKTSLAFNDAWVERARLQSILLKITVDGKVKVPFLAGDGALVATPAGSTAYARYMGATPLPIDAPPHLVLVGSNANWHSAYVNINSVVEFETLDTSEGFKKRPMLGVVDGVRQGLVQKMRVRVSRVAAAELMFLPDRDMTAKVSEIQFAR